MNINELSAKAELNVRLLRKYKHIGLLSPPIGKTSNARYTDQHLAEALKIREFISAGYSLGEVHEKMHGYRNAEATPPSSHSKRSLVETAVLRAYRSAKGLTVTFDDPEDRIPNAEHAAFVARVAEQYEDLRRRYAAPGRSADVTMELTTPSDS